MSEEIRNELSRVQESPNGMVLIEQSRAVQEVQASLIIAKKFPRDINSAFTKIIDSCKRLSLAKQAMYKYPRGGELVTGPSIRLAEVLAQNYGNLNFGVRELERREGCSIAESYCHDLETNVRQNKVFEVPHKIGLKGGKTKILSDGRDIYELVANQAARRLRACILGVIPPDIVEAAVDQVKATLVKGGGEPISDRIRKMVLGFKELGISQEMLEDRLGHAIDLTTAEEIAEFQAIYTTIRDKQAKRGDFFKFPEENEDEGKAAELREKLQNGEKQ